MLNVVAPLKLNKTFFSTFSPSDVGGFEPLIIRLLAEFSTTVQAATQPRFNVIKLFVRNLRIFVIS